MLSIFQFQKILFLSLELGVTCAAVCLTQVPPTVPGMTRMILRRSGLVTSARRVFTIPGRRRKMIMVCCFICNKSFLQLTMIFITAVIRECFSTSILLGSLDNPVLPSSSCSPEPVESDVITACLCTSDMCNDLSSDSEPRGIIPETRVTTLPPRVTQDSRRERTFSPSRNPFNQFTTESFRSVTSPTSSPAVISVPSRNTNRRILCYKCGSLFSRDGNDRLR